MVAQLKVTQQLVLRADLRAWGSGRLPPSGRAECDHLSGRLIMNEVAVSVMQAAIPE